MLIGLAKSNNYIAISIRKNYSSNNRSVNHITSVSPGGRYWLPGWRGFRAGGGETIEVNLSSDQGLRNKGVQQFPKEKM